MELKDRSGELTIATNMFQSHLYGIESEDESRLDFKGSVFQSHLYGIESW